MVGRRGERGFGMLEVVLALGILAVVGTTVAVVLSSDEDEGVRREMARVSSLYAAVMNCPTKIPEGNDFSALVANGLVSAGFDTSGAGISIDASGAERQFYLSFAPALSGGDERRFFSEVSNRFVTRQVAGRNDIWLALGECATSRDEDTTWKRPPVPLPGESVYVIASPKSHRTLPFAYMVGFFNGPLRVARYDLLRNEIQYLGNYDADFYPFNSGYANTNIVPGDKHVLLYNVTTGPGSAANQIAFRVFSAERGTWGPIVWGARLGCNFMGSAVIDDNTVVIYGYSYPWSINTVVCRFDPVTEQMTFVSDTSKYSANEGCNPWGVNYGIGGGYMTPGSWRSTRSNLFRKGDFLFRFGNYPYFGDVRTGYYDLRSLPRNFVVNPTSMHPPEISSAMASTGTHGSIAFSDVGENVLVSYNMAMRTDSPARQGYNVVLNPLTRTIRPWGRGPENMNAVSVYNAPANRIFAAQVAVWTNRRDGFWVRGVTQAELAEFGTLR